MFFTYCVQLSKCLSIIGIGPYPMLLTSCAQTTLTVLSVQLPSDLQSLLAEFEDVL